MKLVRITMDLVLEDDAKPNKWVPDMVWDNLNTHTGEDMVEFDYIVLNEDYKEITSCN
jgi:hypothetical protein